MLQKMGQCYKKCKPTQSPKYDIIPIAYLGEVAEWSIAAVLKTVDPQGSGGSNPSLSANFNCLTAKLATLFNCQTDNNFNKLSSVTVGQFPS